MRSIVPLLAIITSILLIITNGSDLPPRQNVLQIFLLTSSGPFRLHFQDTFCPGLATFIWDNNIFLGTTPSIQTFCGVSVRGDSSVIISPDFTQGDYFFTAGFHNLTVLVYGSPTPNGKATLQLTIFPEPGTKISLNQQSKRHLSSSELQSIIVPNAQPAPGWVMSGSPRQRKSPRLSDMGNINRSNGVVIIPDSGLRLGKIRIV
jgi:hypothetical protein